MKLTSHTKLASSAPTSNKSSRSVNQSPEKTVSVPSPSTTRTRSQTIGSQDSEAQSVSSKEPYIPSHHKRRSQLFDISPSSSDNEDPRTKALLKVQRRRQSRRLSQINLLDGPAFRPLDVLICEDHPVSRIVMERLFEKLRCRTITAVNGSEAVRYALSEVQFDIIMTEVKLPQINGADVARMIRETRSANRHTPIIAVTGYLKDLPETHHFNSLIEKPPTLTKLTEALCKFCFWKPPPKDYVPTDPLNIPPPIARGVVSQAEDSPNSLSSGFHPIPSSSYRGSSRADSVGSSYFGDMDSNKTEDIPVVISRHTDGWGDSSDGLGISDTVAGSPADAKINTNLIGGLNIPSLPHALSAPPTSNSSGTTSPRKQRSSEAIRAKRESLEKRRYEGAESGDDEDEELGNIQARQRAPHGSRGPRSSSKLGTEMMRTNSRGSVVSGSEQILAKEGATESESGDIQDLGGSLGNLNISQENSSSSAESFKPESPRSPRSPDQMRRPALEPLHEYPTEIRSPGFLQGPRKSSEALSTPSKEYTNDEDNVSPGHLSPNAPNLTDSEGPDPDATPRPTPMPALPEPDDFTPRVSSKSRDESNHDHAGGRTGHIHLRDVLHWRKR